MGHRVFITKILNRPKAILACRQWKNPTLKEAQEFINIAAQRIEIREKFPELKEELVYIDFLDIFRAEMERFKSVFSDSIEIDVVEIVGPAGVFIGSEGEIVSL